MKKRKKTTEIRNTDLYEFIVLNYIESDNPVKQKEIAERFGLSIGAIKNFMFRHKLTKKEYYNRLRQQIFDFKSKGLTVQQICKLTNREPQSIYNILYYSKKGVKNDSNK